MREIKACPYCNSSYIRRYKSSGKWKCYSCGKDFDLPIQRLSSKLPTKKRNPNAMEVISYSQLLQLIHNGVNSLRDKTFISIIYLTGARISEVIKRLKAKQISVKEIDDRVFLYVENVYTLKHREAYFRNIPINYEKYKEMCELIKYYLMDFNEEDILFDFNRQRGYNIVRKSLDLFPHYLRTLRCTHLIHEGLDAFDLQKIMGWSSTRPADSYVKKNVEDVMRRM